MSDDPHDLNRFVSAQDRLWPAPIEELRAGRKRTHWMWFVFPQLKGLGHSAAAHLYGIASGAEAEAYLLHPTLGPRLKEATDAVQGSEAASLRDLFGTPDDLKFRSSMTLFAAVERSGVFAQALARWCADGPDPRTLSRL